jgi:beta-lactamase class A
MTLWANIDRELAAAPGTVSAYVGPLGGPPVYTRLPDATHYAASTMKVGVLVALRRAGLDLDAPVPVHNEHQSAYRGTYGNAPADDGDDQVWKRLGGTAPLGWLAERMIVRSGNLATNLCIEAVGLPAVDAVWRAVGATGSVTGRGIEDLAARDAGIDNLVTAHDLAALFTAVVRDEPDLLPVLEAVEQRDDLAAGLPPDTRLAHKSGWITGIRHGAGVVFPPHAPPYVIAVCTSTGLDDAGACGLVTRVSRAAWQSMVADPGHR